MPFSELLRMAKGKGESPSHHKTTDLSLVPDNDFVELVWESGQIMMQGQSSRSKKTQPTTTTSALQSQTHKFRDKDVTPNSRVVKFGTMDSILNDFPMSGLNQDDDMVPWLTLPLEEPLQQDYYTDFLPELSGVTVNDLSTTHNNFTSLDKRNTCSNQATRDSYAGSVHNGLSLQNGNGSRVSATGDVPSRPRASHVYSSSMSSQQCHASGPYFRSKAPDNTSNINNSISTPTGAKIQKTDPGSSTSNLGFTNFSHFSRPLIRANLQNVGAIGSKDSIAVNSNPIESTPINSSNPPLEKEMVSLNRSNSVAAHEASAKSLKESLVERAEATCREDAIKNDKSPNQTVGANAAERIQEGEKVVEPVVASSSVCSGNSVERPSYNPTHKIKRKRRDMEDSECPSDDVEEDSIGARKAAPARGIGSKRSRAAEVHNLSERRRRDRINEKMRALQELIPNCNKVDKASMLDEAIEYLKTLQLQVQIMSMGTGLCMPPMMQHMHAAQMQHFSPMGVGIGMGMGMGFGMGMLDMNGGCSMIQPPHMQRPHFLSPPISGTTGVHPMAGPNYQVFGVPGQGFPLSTQRTPTIPFSGGAATADPSTSKEPMKNLDLQVLHNNHPNASINQTSAQGEATREGVGQKAPDRGSSEAVVVTEELV